VCDEVIAKCVDWDTHCVCDGSPEWAVERAKAKRRAEKAAGGPGPAADSADAVNRRYQQAQDVATGAR
jgi:hypothetical protein